MSMTSPDELDPEEYPVTTALYQRLKIDSSISAIEIPEILQGADLQAIGEALVQLIAQVRDSLGRAVLELAVEIDNHRRGAD